MEQKEAVMVLFDREEEYARLLSEFLRRQKRLIKATDEKSL